MGELMINYAIGLKITVTLDYVPNKITIYPELYSKTLQTHLMQPKSGLTPLLHLLIWILLLSMMGVFLMDFNMLLVLPPLTIYQPYIRPLLEVNLIFIRFLLINSELIVLRELMHLFITVNSNFLCIINKLLIYLLCGLLLRLLLLTRTLLISNLLPLIP